MTYGCHNKPRPNPDGFYVAQDGHYDIGVEHQVPVHRTPIFVAIPMRNSTHCQYTLDTADARCNGCQWQHGPTIAPGEPGSIMPAARGMAPPRPERPPGCADIPAWVPPAPTASPT